MISRLELAGLLFNYSPTTTPHETLSSVRNAMASAFERIEELHARIATVNPEAVYEHQGDVFFRERSVQRKTPKRIILEPEFEGDRGKHLSRTKLENGDFVTHNHGEVFVLGASLRRKLEQDAERIKSDVAGLVLTEMEIEEALARNDELVLKWEEWQVFNRYWQQLGQPTDCRIDWRGGIENVDWLTEGF